MGGTNSHRQVITGEDWMRSQEKRLQHEERRPTIQHASDLLGPGFGPKMVLIRDWNAEEARFNGFFVTPPGSLNTPDNAKWWGGITFGQNEGYGFQHVYDFRGTIWPPAQYVRKFYPQGTTTGYSAWMSVTGSGGPPGAHTHPISDVSALQSALDARALTGLTLTAGLGLTGGGNLTANRSFAVDFAASGTPSSTKAVRADDLRLSNSRTPVAHTHALDDLSAGVLSVPLTMEEIGTQSPAPSGTDRLYFKPDGRLYVMDTAGNERPLVPPEGSLVLNPSFDLYSGSVPTGWNLFWANNGATAVTDVTTYFNGGASLKVTVPTTGSQAVVSSVFAVTEGSVVTLNFWARGASTADKVNVNMLLDSTGNGDPDFFDGTSTWAAPFPATIPLIVGWARYSLSWVIPAGKVTGRFVLNPHRTNGTTATVWLDETSSEMRMAAEAQVIPGSISLWITTRPTPTGYLPMDGTTYNTDDYQNLAAALGATGSTFVVPSKTDTQGMKYLIKT